MRAPKTLWAGLALTLIGAGAYVYNASANTRQFWIPGEGDLPTKSGESVEIEFTAPMDGYCELEIAVDDRLDRELRNRVVLTTNDSDLDVGWEVELDSKTIASGDSRVYLYLQWGPPSLSGRMRRILLRDPIAQNEVFWRSFGWSGVTTVGRGIGRFPIRAGKRYAVRAVARKDYAYLEGLTPRLLVKLERRLWASHYQTARWFGYGALACLTAGGAALLAGLVQMMLRKPVSL